MVLTIARSAWDRLGPKQSYMAYVRDVGSWHIALLKETISLSAKSSIFAGWLPNAI